MGKVRGCLEKGGVVIPNRVGKARGAGNAFLAPDTGSGGALSVMAQDLGKIHRDEGDNRDDGLNGVF
jgi:hypothetical protein